MPETVHTKSIRERISWLNELSSEHSRLYRSPEAYLNRARYQARYPTCLFPFKCMDGRLHLPYIMKTPPIVPALFSKWSLTAPVKAAHFASVQFSTGDTATSSVPRASRRILL
ncbi:MAG: hypothetical protein ACYC9Y_00560 [Candidatus Methylomirabilia bacterium]